MDVTNSSTIGGSLQISTILVQLTDDVAEITVNIMVRYGYKIPQLCEKVQENVKSSVQNMTCITVSKVNIVVTGVAQETAGPEAE